MLPKVSIVILTYNRANLLPVALESALKQNYNNLEIIVMDDCSKDQTSDVMKPYLQNQRIKYIRNAKNQGQFPNAQKALMEIATGEYIIYLSDDDAFIDEFYIREAIEVIQKDRDISFVFANYESYDGQKGIKQYVQDYPINSGIFSGNEIWNHWTRLQPYWGTCLFKKNIAISNGGFWNEIVSMDALFVLSMALQHKVGYIKKNIVRMENGECLTRATNDMKENLEKQWGNMDFIRIAAGWAIAKKIDSQEISKWQEENITHLIFLMIRDYVFKNNGKSIEKKILEIYEKARTKGEERCLIKAESLWLNYLYKNQG